MTRAAILLLLLLLLAACSASQLTADLPPAGEVWFGKSFDTSTFEIQGRLTTVGAAAPFSMVAHFNKAVEGSEFAIRVSWNGTLVSNTPAAYEGNSEIWGFSPGPLIQAGLWRYEFTDIGGNVLAAGEITAH